MNAYFLHLASPERDGAPAVIAGDTEALLRLRNAINDAISGGAGAARFYSSDGEVYDMVLMREQDMGAAYTAYRNEVAPQRSLREVRRLEQLDNYAPALRLLHQLGKDGDNAARHVGTHGGRPKALAIDLRCAANIELR
ncbi:hypothetical protein [Duganella hordei]|uniref:hypothetical protein n=1 Tax=Duganella hordei TaxID=2865934 RepID=UPI0030E88CB0